MDYKQVATAIYDGITSMPLDLVYGAKRTYLGSGALGSEYKLRNEEENERLFRSIKMGIDNRKPIYRAIQIILDDFFNSLPDEVKHKVYTRILGSGFHMAGRTATQILVVRQLSQYLVSQIVDRALYQRLFKFGIWSSINTALIMGVIERAALASRQLLAQHPDTYYKLRRENLDMIYFLIEPAMENYLAFIKAYRNKELTYARINSELNKIFS
ncbi:hypothetical protein [Serratia odorifera]|uniref:Uncharacterized protein n=3 Tax=Serratia odorifera TaxID=618 RepID=D4E241_SEROD|nr:hypothetical protein [Serratia odorifera]EFE96155.1 hypothetical protein HMPREF0758_2241 [Serratia odorifera DSM 4582]PNK90728.1 hypothetical protein CEQ31_014085 [Serratia odorifera]RII71851.1 hypothetical protein DX901_12270 [Serratia odorifera]VDZ58293.1 Uncharacterised protein [Serratia odorifera]HEJ9097664.1 hypothetical protein [Serratia odorifera]